MAWKKRKRLGGDVLSRCEIVNVDALVLLGCTHGQWWVAAYQALCNFIGAGCISANARGGALRVAPFAREPVVCRSVRSVRVRRCAMQAALSLPVAPLREATVENNPTPTAL